MKYITPVVVNKYKSEYDEYIGRGSKWGNPFPIDETAGQFRHIVIERYKNEFLLPSIENGRLTIQDFLDLSGKRLGCFCSPKDCHGDAIVEVFNMIVEMLNDSG